MILTHLSPLTSYFRVALPGRFGCTGMYGSLVGLSSSLALPAAALLSMLCVFSLVHGSFMHLYLDGSQTVQVDFYRCGQMGGDHWLESYY